MTPELGVEAAFLPKFLMCAILHDLILVLHVYQVEHVLQFVLNGASFHQCLQMAIPIQLINLFVGIQLQICRHIQIAAAVQLEGESL